MGIELHVLTWGDESAPKVLLLHGFQDGGASWDLVAPKLVEAGLCAIAPDLRGFGSSGWVPEGGYYHFPDYVFDVAELADQLAPDPFFLVGHSMGGNVATMYASTFPERVKKLVLLEGVGPPAMPESMTVDRVRAWIDGVRKSKQKEEKTMSFDEAVRRLSIGHPAVEPEIIRRRAEQLTKPRGEGVVWTFDPLHRTRSPIAFSVERWRAHASRVVCPTLSVGGGHTGFHPEDEAERIAMIADVRATEIEGAGHMMHWTRPDEVARLLVQFLCEPAFTADAKSA
ncbi:MAG: alpha/beta fold hydrolase [Polyangiales bacterium]